MLRKIGFYFVFCGNISVNPNEMRYYFIDSRAD